MRFIITALIVAAIVGSAIWALYEFVYKGTVEIEAGEKPTVTIATLDGKTVVEGAQSSYKLAPGTYRVTLKSDKFGTSKHVTVSPLSSQKVQLGTTQKLYTDVAANSALYGAIVSGDVLVGFDPLTESLKRVDQASQERAYEELTRVTAYQPYRAGQAIVGTGDRLAVVTSGGLQNLNLEGISVEGGDENKFIVATNPQQESFVVAYKQDVFLYENVSSKPKKIYTAKKQFDSLVFGGSTIGLYATALPYSKEDLRSQFDNYQIDLLLVDTNSKQEQTVKGPLTTASLSPDGALATVKERDQQAYLFNTQTKEKVTDIDHARVLWVSNSNFVYALNKALWRYDTNQQSSQQVANLPRQTASITQDGADGFYVTTYEKQTRATVYHVTTTKPPAAEDTLANITPYETTNLLITYTSITRPTVVIQTRAILNNASQLDRFREDTQALRQQALNYLTSQGVNLDGVAVIYDPADPL
ncbi:MAG: hypothetical protein ACREGJ_04110 [Candidatus Saccharimonadales bacterium]